jgi:prepilin-type N-terminal cleavage/methylation domain-containing protein
MRSVPRRGRLSKHPAFTLVEVIASIVIVAVLAVTSASLLGNVTSGYTAAATRAELINDGSAALERLVTSIRDIPLRASVTPAEPSIATITTDSITWDGNQGFALSGTNLQLTVTGVTTTLLGNVSNFQVRAFDQNSAAMAVSLSGNACDPVRRIELTFTLSRNGVSETLRTRVFLRCMMNGASA